jgi:hypothetical protein
MNAILAAFRDVVQYVADKEFQMHITARNVSRWRRTEMDVRKIVNLGSAKTDLWYERKKYGFKKR